MTVPRSHPRYLSLTTRDRLVEGYRRGLVAQQGLIAHGRGEAFDYLLGEVTTEAAMKSIRVAASMLVRAERPVISVNGNVAALSCNEVATIANLLGCPAEVNLFHRTEERVLAIMAVLEESGCERILGTEPDSLVPGLDHARAGADSRGIFNADVVLVPLEDGDRCSALKAMGKKVITIDLNPLSRTARTADVTIVDNIVRAMPALESELRRRSENGQAAKDDDASSYDNQLALDMALDLMARKYLMEGDKTRK